MTTQKNKASFRDPSGFIFSRDGKIYRQVNVCYKKNYDALMGSGLYQALVDKGLLISHEEVDIEGLEGDKSYRVIKPEQIPFISYPYEWCFSQLKGAALATLRIQKIALDFGMSLKDCSAYNIQFRNTQPVFIDTLSFEEYHEGPPWGAYRQFCQHFLAPLALMSYRDVRLSELLQVYIDGIPLDLTSSLLPVHTLLRFPLLLHIHLHAKSQKRFSNKPIRNNPRKISRLSFLGLIDSLESAIKKMKWHPEGTEWGNYYEDTNYSSDAFLEKKQTVASLLSKTNPKSVWDIGANTGVFSRVANDAGIQTVSFDIDPAAIEKNYLECVKNHRIDFYPLLLDVTNPSPGIGWENQERVSIIERGPAETVLALALIHHLAISNNLPFNKISEFFSKICNSLIIEFIPKCDSQVQRILSTREDIFLNYTQEEFEHAFSEHFVIEFSRKFKDSERTLYLMKRKGI